MPETFAETPDGLVLVASGHDAVMRWDGMTSFLESAGIEAPTQKPTLTGTGVGAIVGTYYAYLRFVDRLGNVSNLSPISLVYEATGSTGTITNATNATPIVITTGAAHGLLTGATVKIAGVGGNTSANSTWTITVLTTTTFSLDTSVTTATYTGGGTWTSGIASVTYGNLESAADPKVVRRQILRNTDGQTDTFYVDVDTNLYPVSLSSTRSDSDLSAQEAVPLLNVDASVFANRYTVPPNYKQVIAHHRDRMFMAVDREYSSGMVQVAQGSATVTGIGTSWTSAMAGRFLWVTGADRYYEIDSVSTSAQTLTLIEPYTNSTDLFAQYSIRPASAERRLVYFSESGLPEAWPATNAVELQEDGDFLTGLMPKGSFLFILENLHVYRFTFGSNPLDDGGIFLAANRGCVNHRCWAIVGNAAYMLDEEGIHKFGDDEDAEPVSQPIGDLFGLSTGNSRFKINWEAREQFHALHFQPEGCIRWFVCLDGHWIPHHAICLNYRDNRFWLEQFHHGIGASTVGQLKRNLPQQYLGTLGDILAYGAGRLDGPSLEGGTVRGMATAATLGTLTDTAAIFPTEGVAGTTLAIIAGTGKGQARSITAVSGTTLSVDQPWLIQPDATSQYQIGGVNWRWRSGWFRFYPSEESNVRRLEMVFQPLQEPATLDLRIRLDFSSEAYTWGTKMNSEDGGGVSSEEGSADLVCDLTKRTGLVQRRLDGSKELFMDGRRFIQLELEGFANDEQARVYELSIDGGVSRGD